MNFKRLAVGLVSLNCLTQVSLAESPEEKIVDQELIAYQTVTMDNFYIGDMGSLAYELYESQALEECSKVLTKIGNFALGEQSLARDPAAIKLLAKSHKSLLALSQKLLTEKPPSLSQIEKALSQVDQGLVLSYGKADNEALKKELIGKDEELVFSYQQAYNLQDVFELVYEKWLGKKPKEAVRKLEKAIEFVASEVSISQSEEGRTALEAAHKELVSLKNRMNRNEVKTTDELEAAFAQTHQALATAYQKRSLLAKFGDRKKRLQKEAQQQAEAARAKE